MLLDYVSLKDVVFKLHACSPACQEGLAASYSEQQKRLQEKMDSDYEDMILRAKASERGKPVSDSIASIVTTFNPPPYRAGDIRSRHQRRCTIM